jgi:hypothetical protein
MDASTKESIVWAAIAYVGKKRSQRDLLPVGDTRLSIEIIARVGRAKFLSTLNGKLHVSPDGKAASESGASMVEVATALLAAMPDDETRTAVMESLTAHFEAKGSLPASPDPLTKQTKAWLSRLRSTTSEFKHGAVTFSQFEK